jgi:hypothetical protein
MSIATAVLPAEGAGSSLEGLDRGRAWIVPDVLVIFLIFFGGAILSALYALFA